MTTNNLHDEMEQNEKEEEIKDTKEKKTRTIRKERRREEGITRWGNQKIEEFKKANRKIEVRPVAGEGR